MADISSGPVLHIKKCTVITIFRLKCHNQFYRHEKSSANTMCKRDVVNYHSCNLGVTLDRMLSYREHFTKTADKLKNRNNLLMKVAVPPGAPAPTVCGHLLWRFAIQQQSTARQSGHALLTQVRSMYSWTLPCISSLVRWYPPFYTSPMASSALQHWTASPTKEGCHWQSGEENRQTWQLANAPWYT